MGRKFVVTKNKNTMIIIDRAISTNNLHLVNRKYTSNLNSFHLWVVPILNGSLSSTLKKKSTVFSLIMFTWQTKFDLFVHFAPALQNEVSIKASVTKINPRNIYIYIGKAEGIIPIKDTSIDVSYASASVLVFVTENVRTLVVSAATAMVGLTQTSNNVFAFPPIASFKEIN